MRRGSGASAGGTDKLGRQKMKLASEFESKRLIGKTFAKASGLLFPPHFNPSASLLAFPPRRPPPPPRFTPSRRPPFSPTPPLTVDNNHASHPEASRLLPDRPGTPSESQPTPVSAGPHPPYADAWLALALQACAATPASAAAVAASPTGPEGGTEEQAAAVASASAGPSTPCRH